MRSQLKRVTGQRRQFTARFERFGVKTQFRGQEGRTVLLVDVRDEQEQVVADHLWFSYTKGFAALNLQPGVHVKFDARVSPYIKGYHGHQEDTTWQHPIQRDYRLERPTKIELTQPTQPHSNQHATTGSLKKQQITVRLDWLRTRFLLESDKRGWSLTTRENFKSALRSSRFQLALFDALLELFEKAALTGEEPVFSGLVGFTPSTSEKNSSSLMNARGIVKRDRPL
jgi:hypothetical protein